jgi:hypothetical protein
MKPHKHEKFIKLMADGVRIEFREKNDPNWMLAYCGFNAGDLEFRIAHDQPADEEGWIPWFGGEAPAISERIDVRFKNWPTQKNTTAGQWRWEIRDRETDIVAYRIVKQVKKWRWMFFYPASIQPSAIYMSEPFTEDQATKYFNGFTRLRVKPEWKMEVECDE